MALLVVVVCLLLLGSGSSGMAQDTQSWSYKPRFTLLFSSKLYQGTPAGYTAIAFGLNFVPPNGQTCPVSKDVMALVDDTGQQRKRSRAGAAEIPMFGSQNQNYAPGCVTPYIHSNPATLYCVDYPNAFQSGFAQGVVLFVQDYNCSRTAISYPADVFGANAEVCTNGTPILGELCIRQCQQNSDCPSVGNRLCVGGVCMCQYYCDTSGTPQFLCRTQSAAQPGFCMCYAGNGNACSGNGKCTAPPYIPGAGDTTVRGTELSTGPDTRLAFTTSNIEWAYRYQEWGQQVPSDPTKTPRYLDSVLNAYAPMRAAYSNASLTSAGGVTYTVVLSDTTGWYESSEFSGINTASSPTMCLCNPGFSGANCDNNIDQCGKTICGGQGADCVTPTTFNPSCSGNHFWDCTTGNAVSMNPNWQETFTPTAQISFVGLPQVTLKCACSLGTHPMDVILFPQPELREDYWIIPGSGCYNIDKNIAYCSNQGQWVDETGQCQCLPGFAGYSCAGSCMDVYCTGHAASCQQVSRTDYSDYKVNICGVCAAGWGPVQTNTVTNDPAYAQVWCAQAYGPPLVGGGTAPLECNGVGFAVPSVLLQYLGLPSSLVAWNGVTNFVTHPLQISFSMQIRGYSVPSQLVLDKYTSVFNTLASGVGLGVCFACDPGYIPNGASCATDTTAAWTVCHASDPSCTSGLLPPDNSLCGQASGRGAPAFNAAGTVYSCACNDGLNGNACQEVRCAWAFGLACSGNGYCMEPINRCVCNPGRVGMACEIPYSTSACSGRGQVARVNPAVPGNQLGEATYDLSGTGVKEIRTVWY